MRLVLGFVSILMLVPTSGRASPHAYLLTKDGTRICLLGTLRNEPLALDQLGPQTRACYEQAATLLTEGGNAEAFEREMFNRFVSSLNENTRWIPAPAWRSFTRYTRNAEARRVARRLTREALLVWSLREYNLALKTALHAQGLSAIETDPLSPREVENTLISTAREAGKDIVPLDARADLTHVYPFEQLISRAEVVQVFEQLFVDAPAWDARLAQHVAERDEVEQLHRELKTLFVDGASFEQIRHVRQLLDGKAHVNIANLLTRKHDVERRHLLRHAHWLPIIQKEAATGAAFVMVDLAHILDDRFGAANTLLAEFVAEGYAVRRLDDCAGSVFVPPASNR